MRYIQYSCYGSERFSENRVNSFIYLLRLFFLVTNRGFINKKLVSLVAELFFFHGGII